MAGCASQQISYVCSDGRTVTDKAQCTAPQLTIESELSVCYGMPIAQSGSLEDMCIMGLAAKHKDGLLCKKISRDSRTACYALVAEAKEDPAACSEAEPQQDYCYEQYARDKKDGSVCSNIKDISYKDSCYSNLANQLGDPALCDKMTNAYQRDYCYYNMAQRFGDSSYCNKIVDTNQKQQCLQIRGGQSAYKEAMAKG